MLRKELAPYIPKVKGRRVHTLARLAAGIVMLPAASLAVTACLEANDPQPDYSHEASDPTQDSGGLEENSNVNLSQLVEDYLQSVFKPDPFRQNELIVKFPLITSSGEKTLGECLGNVGFTQSTELPSESGDRLILRVSLTTGEDLTWQFEKQSGVWKLPQTPQCPVDRSIDKN